MPSKSFFPFQFVIFLILAILKLPSSQLKYAGIEHNSWVWFKLYDVLVM